MKLQYADIQSFALFARTMDVWPLWLLMQMVDSEGEVSGIRKRKKNKIK